MIILSVISLGKSFSNETRQFIVGITVNANLVFFYGAPLSTIFKVMKTRSSASIHIPTMITNTLNGIFWTAFGIAVFDWFIAVPNGLGALLGGIQFVLCIFFPRKPSSSESATKEDCQGIVSPGEIKNNSDSPSTGNEDLEDQEEQGTPDFR